MPKTILEPKGVWKSEHFKFSQAVRSGDMLYLAGQTGIDPSGKVVPGGFKEQTKEAFRNIERILEESGGSFKDVLRLTAYFTDMNNLGAYTEIMNEVSGGKDFPAQTVIEVKSLALKELEVEIDAIASLR